MIRLDALDQVIGQDVYDHAGEKIGSASEVYLNDQTGQPEWVTVKTGLFGTKESFVPIHDAHLTDDGVRVHVSKDKVKDAPKIDTGGHLSPQEEEELYRYYGLGGSWSGTQNTPTAGPVTGEEVRLERESITDVDVDRSVDGAAISEQEHEVTLNAERPIVEKEAVPVERVRLDKETVTDHETVSDQVHKEQTEMEGVQREGRTRGVGLTPPGPGDPDSDY